MSCCSCKTGVNVSPCGVTYRCFSRLALQKHKCKYHNKYFTCEFFKNRDEVKPTSGVTNENK